MTDEIQATDLVAFLRSQGHYTGQPAPDELSWCKKMLAAADEIERLHGIIKSALGFHQATHIRAALSVAFTHRIEGQTDG